MIPVRVVIDRTLSRNVSVDWRASLIVGSSIAALWYLGFCVSTFVDIHRDAVRGRSPRQSFPANAFVTGVYGLALVLSAVLVVGTHREGDPMWMQLLPLVFVLIAFYGWPR